MIAEPAVPGSAAATSTATTPLAQRLVGAAAYVENLPRGERAILRRLGLRTEEVPPEVFWRIVERYEIPRGEEEFWIGVLPLMVKHQHTPGRRLGAALAASGVSAPRLERWLRLDADAAFREADRLLARVEGGLDWRSFGQLLRFWSEEGRRTLARDFFLSPEYRARSATTIGAES